jgi:hypothetical protein
MLCAAIAVKKAQICHAYEQLHSNVAAWHENTRRHKQLADEVVAEFRSLVKESAAGAHDANESHHHDQDADLRTTFDAEAAHVSSLTSSFGLFDWLQKSCSRNSAGCCMSASASPSSEASGRTLAASIAADHLPASEC